MEHGAGSYIAAGGKRTLSDYYTSECGSAVFHPSLRQNVVFWVHNLTTDQSFNEFNVILCRNVLIYFKKPLHQRVHHLLYESLSRFGILGLGQRETLEFTPHRTDYEPLEPEWKLYRRVR